MQKQGANAGGEQETGGEEVEARPTENAGAESKLFSRSDAEAFYSELLKKYGKQGFDEELGAAMLGVCKGEVDAGKMWFWREFSAYKRKDLSTVSVAAFSDAKNTEAFLKCSSKSFNQMSSPKKISASGVTASFYKAAQQQMDTDVELAVFTYENVYVYLLANDKTGVQNVFSEVAAMLAA